MGKPVLAAARQGHLIGVAPVMWGDTERSASPGRSGDIGTMRLLRNGGGIGQTGFPFGVFEVPADDALYELSLNQAQPGQPAAVRKRSTQLLTTWKFRSRLDEGVYS
ncbi:hypothetical protein [Streptomyces sp. NPDC018833]|uniref:hypothetical protein n=1 Tax=Streptomyces sp. NPDC018833 TaxID=3365053 RepID=UPI0037B1FCD7